MDWCFYSGLTLTHTAFYLVSNRIYCRISRISVQKKEGNFQKYCLGRKYKYVCIFFKCSKDRRKGKNFLKIELKNKIKPLWGVRNAHVASSISFATLSIALSIFSNN